MRSPKHLHPSLSWMAALTALGAMPAQAQDRGLASPLVWPRSPALEVSQTRAGWDPSFTWGPVRVMPSLQVTPGGFWGGEVGVEAGGNWFGGLRLGRSPVRRDDGLPAEASHAVMLSGGYRWGSSQSVSLQLVRDRRDSLGLAVSYDWPSYYVRVGLDNKTRFTPQETLRLSAGVRF
jgi:hypothetical protein